MTFYSAAPVNFAPVSQVTATLGVNDPEVGTIIRAGNAEYVFVYNVGNSQISPGFGATLSGVSGYSVSVSSVAETDTLVGICVNTTLTTATYGWLLRRGFGPGVAAVDSGVSTGAILTTAADGKVSQKTISTGFCGPILGKAMTSAASNASFAAYWNLF